MNFIFLIENLWLNVFKFNKNSKFKVIKNSTEKSIIIFGNAKLLVPQPLYSWNLWKENFLKIFRSFSSLFRFFTDIFARFSIFFLFIGLTVISSWFLGSVASFFIHAMEFFLSDWCKMAKFQWARLIHWVKFHLQI